MTRMSKPEFSCDVKTPYLRKPSQRVLRHSVHAYPLEATAPEFALAYAGALH